MVKCQTKSFPGCHCKDPENSSGVDRCLESCRYTGSDDDGDASLSDFEDFFCSRRGLVEPDEYDDSSVNSLDFARLVD